MVGDFGGGGMFLAFGVVCALLEAQRSGEGQVVDTAMVDGSAVLMTMFWAFKQMGAFDENARGTNLLDTGAHFYDVYRCADGEYISIGSIEPQFYAELLRLAELEGDEGLRRPDGRRPLARPDAALQAAGLRPGSLSEIRAFASAGTITTQFPAAGTEVQPGAPVDLVVTVPLGLPPWALAGIGIGLALAAAGSLARRIRSRRPSVPPVFSFAPQADPGEQSVSAESGRLTDSAFTIEAHVDRGVQTLDMSSRRAA